MPTNGSARYSSSLSTRTFTKNIPVLSIDKEEFDKICEDGELLASLESLDAHKNALTVRKNFLLENKMSIDRYLRKNIKDSPAYDGVDPSDKLSDESGITSEKIIKQNANENPFGSELNLTKNLSQINIHEYPDPNQKRLRKAL